jgi:hypothetical protein
VNYCQLRQTASTRHARPNSIHVTPRRPAPGLAPVERQDLGRTTCRQRFQLCDIAAGSCSLTDALTVDHATGFTQHAVRCWNPLPILLSKSDPIEERLPTMLDCVKSIISMSTYRFIKKIHHRSAIAQGRYSPIAQAGLHSPVS